VEAAREAKVFKPHEVQALQEVLDDYHAGDIDPGTQAITYERDGKVVGFAYFAPVEMTDNTWCLWWIVVARPTQAAGIGGTLLRNVESEVRKAGGRLLVVETSSLPHYDLSRKFYVKHGYKQVSQIPDFYADGDDMVTYSKHLIEKK
jgi:ribosomal protein S18 acetylase RimI-like enzyme